MQPEPKDSELYDLPDDLLEAPAKWGPVVRSAILLFLFVPIGFLFGLIRFSPGARTAVPGYGLSLTFNFVVFLGFTHFLLVQKWDTWVLPQIEQKTVPFVRVLCSFLLWAMPLVSFGYYLGHITQWKEAPELFLAVLPPTLIAAIFYEVQRKTYLSSLFLAVTSFTSLFLFNDVYAPFYTLTNFAAKGEAIYFVRLVCVGLAIVEAGRTIRLSPQERVTG